MTVAVTACAVDFYSSDCVHASVARLARRNHCVLVLSTPMCCYNIHRFTAIIQVNLRQPAPQGLEDFVGAKF